MLDAECWMKNVGRLAWMLHDNIDMPVVTQANQLKYASGRSRALIHDRGSWMLHGVHYIYC